MDYNGIVSFYKNKKVLITGNTGFKGSWLTFILLEAGAEVTGYALKPSTHPSLFKLIDLDHDSRLDQVYADVCDLKTMRETFLTACPEIVFHLAAQPIVRESYRDPVKTYNANVMGTVNVCESVRQTESVRSFLNVTTDKVYKNLEWSRGYRENDELDGQDPYSNSKSCSELVTHSYKESFFYKRDIGVSTARAGNVIGGGDFSLDRIIPDCVRGVEADGVIHVRNPYSTRPYQHVFESLFAYLMIAKMQYEDKGYAGYYNVGPDDVDCVATGDLVNMFCEEWNKKSIDAALSWENKAEAGAPKEAVYLKLDCSKLKHTFGWSPRWHIKEAVKQTVNWTKVWLDSDKPEHIKAEMTREIKKFTGLVF